MPLPNQYNQEPVTKNQCGPTNARDARATCLIALATVITTHDAFFRG